MAIGWITILKTVPWADVISNAPKVANGAKKLWNTVARKPPASATTDTDISPETAPESLTREALAARVHAVETRIAELQNEMLSSTELISALAEQNAELVKRIEVIRLRVLWLGAVVIVSGIVAITCLFSTTAMP